jgi:hypothetical protein
VDNIKTDVRGLEWGGTDCIDLIVNRDQWRALVNKVMTLNAQLAASHEGLSSMKLGSSVGIHMAV